MAELPLVSVITVSYNSALYIRDAIESVLAQQYHAIEYIIADDCSRDNTWDIITSYSDPRLKVFRNEKNIGEYPNRNKAIELASGKYLIFIDGDDIIYPNGIEYFVSHMERFPTACMAVQKGYYNNLLFPALLVPEETLTNHFYGVNGLLSSSFTSNFFRTAILQQWMLKNNVVTGDEFIRLQLAAQYPVLFIAGWVSWPRETPGQASSTLKYGSGLAESYHFALEILGDKKEQFSPGLVDDIWSLLTMRIAKLVIALLRRGNVAHARALIARSGLPIATLFKAYFFQPLFKDFLTAYSSVNPFRRNFLHNDPQS